MDEEEQQPAHAKSEDSSAEYEYEKVEFDVNEYVRSFNQPKSAKQVEEEARAQEEKENMEKEKQRR
jgi:hypothetical protein